MKKLLTVILTAALLLSVFCVPAYAAGAEIPEPTVGPWDGFWWMTGGPMIAFDTNGGEEYPIYYRHGMTAEAPIITDNDILPGATYDKDSNTLTIENVRLPEYELNIFYMGDDFKLNVKGECELGYISVRNYFGYHNTSLSITGTGSLTVNASKSRKDAMYFFADGVNITHLDIADSVTVNLYAQENADDTLPQHVMSICGTNADPAITIGGSTFPEAKSERKKEIINDRVNGVWVENTDKVYEHGKRVTSKTDPDGIYAVKEIQYSAGNGFETRYGVTKYKLFTEFNMYLPDPDFNDPDYDFKMLTKEDFEAGFDYVLAPLPKKIRYTTDEREAKRGYRGIKMIKADDPDGVYIATRGWDTSFGGTLPETLSTYYIYPLRWDDAEQMYIQEGTYIDRINENNLEDSGYTVATETVERKETIKCWVKGAPYDETNRQQTFDLVTRSSDPDGMYVFGSRYTNRPIEDESGVNIYPVVYDEENGEYYVRGYYGGTVGVDLFKVIDEDWESDNCDFAYKMETVEQRAELQYIFSGYDFEYYSTEATLLTKDGEPEQPYCDYSYKTSDGEERHIVSPIEWREDKGHYYDNDAYSSSGTFNSVEEMEAAGYHIVLEDQPVTYTTTGAVKISADRFKYVDDSGNNYYFGDWIDGNKQAYTYSESNVFAYGGKDYHIGTPVENVTENDLQEVKHELIRDDYSWWIEGTEFHHEGATAAETYILGDADGDGVVTIDDATAVQKYLAGYDMPESFSLRAADIDGNGITIDDATNIQKYLAQYELPYRIGEAVA